MKVQIKATGITLTPSIEDYVHKKVSALQKFFKDDDEVFVAIEVGKTTDHHKGGSVFRAEVSLRAPGNQYYASSEREDLYAAIDEVKDEVAREVVSKKQKKETLLRRGGAKIKAFIKRLNWKRNE